jgi:hypothetical protein
MMRMARSCALVGTTLVLGVGLAGCGSGTSSGSTSSAIGNAALQAVDVAAQPGAFHEPVDAAPTPDGSTIYFLATGSSGPAVFSVPAGGGPVTTVAQGSPLVKPTGIGVATDGSAIYVADQQAPTVNATGGPGPAGAILAAPITGTHATPGTPETPSVLPGTEGTAPVGLDVVNEGLPSDGAGDEIYFTGTDPVTREPGLFEVSPTGGTVVTVAEGSPFVSPDSVAVAADGVAYVTDQGAGLGLGKVFEVTGGTITPILTNLRLGLPAGVTLIDNDTTLLVSSLDPSSHADQLLFLDLKTGKTAIAVKLIGVNTGSAGGLHQAYDASVLAWADTTGSVYRIRFP